MRVYFAPCGIGLGHVGRSIPIAKKLLEGNSEVIFSTYFEGVRYVERENFPLVEAPPIGFQVKPDGSVDFRQTAVNPGPFFASFTLMKQVNAEVKTIGTFKPDIVVSDTRISPLLAAKILGIPIICILNQFQMRVPRRKHYLIDRSILQAETLDRLAEVQKEAAKYDGLENAVKTVVEVAKK